MRKGNINKETGSAPIRPGYMRTTNGKTERYTKAVTFSERLEDVAVHTLFELSHLLVKLLRLIAILTVVAMFGWILDPDLLRLAADIASNSMKIDWKW